MGGHNHHHKPYVVPSHEIYKVESCPELLEVQQLLAKRGLKDPWLRNEVWRYDRKEWGTVGSRARTLFLRGYKIGIPAFLATLAVEYAFGWNQGHHGSGHGAEHGEHH